MKSIRFLLFNPNNIILVRTCSYLTSLSSTRRSRLISMALSPLNPQCWPSNSPLQLNIHLNVFLHLYCILPPYLMLFICKLGSLTPLCCVHQNVHGFLSLAQAFGTVQGDTIVFTNVPELGPVQPVHTIADKSSCRSD